MPMRATPACIRSAVSRRQPGNAFSTCQPVVEPWIAISSFSLAVSIPAVFVLMSVIFVDPAL